MAQMLIFCFACPYLVTSLYFFYHSRLLAFIYTELKSPHDNAHHASPMNAFLKTEY